ncbi:tRNA methyltransferase complex GCD14 subunit [Leucogyrophana mollusca]|uniref:tRNA methyltransferase complex GCD14 subunit n=1 Tax=Leucogyrophana mollusca TaxID=85980 RepID=A0ACB8BIC9_9AGAM|nr:tRNA methyltransferase complex GCD14 subunit [Leucogyrophana mollusca]
MWSTDREVAVGDVVIIWQTRDIIQPLLITPGKDFNSRFGHYRHADLIGIPYGSKVGSRNGKGFIHVLRPTPELWTMALPHRTQILYLADIAFITSWLDIRRGSRIIEAGTGSGSFSHSVVRTIGSAGHLWSYEFHEARADKAREEFNRHGMADIVTLTHRNVCKDGFTVTDTVDSVFLDLPAPWDAVDHAKKALRKDCTTRICCFSPCMEQVLRTVSALNDAGFTDITMYETLLRPHDVHQIPAALSLSEIIDRLKKSELKREEKRLRQIANSSKRKRDDSVDGVDQEEGGKKVKREGGAGGKLEEEPEVLDTTVEPVKVVFEGHMGTTPAPGQVSKVNVSKAIQEVRGHTSYLTFARLVPTPAENGVHSSV